jgi:hypothetical protein
MCLYRDQIKKVLIQRVEMIVHRLTTTGQAMGTVNAVSPLSRWLELRRPRTGAAMAFAKFRAHAFGRFGAAALIVMIVPVDFLTYM